MEFVRKKKRSQSQKVRRTWFSEEGYRIVWRKEVCGVLVPARFQACVRVLVPYSDGRLRPMWDFVNRNRRLMKTLKATKDECEKHERTWTKACEATGVRALKELFGGKLAFGLPLWVRKKMDRRLYAILIDNRPLMKNRDEEEAESCTESLSSASDAPGPGGPTKTSDSSVSPTEAASETLTPASPVAGKRRSMTRTTRRVRSMDTATSDASTVPSAEAAARGQEKPAVKRKASTTDSSGSGAKRSRDSRKTRSLLSAS